MEGEIISEHTQQLKITEVEINGLNPAAYNPRKWSEKTAYREYPVIRAGGSNYCKWREGL